MEQSHPGQPGRIDCETVADNFRRPSSSRCCLGGNTRCPSLMYRPSMRAGRQSGTQPKGDYSTSGRASNQIEVVPNGLTVQAQLSSR